MADLGEYLSEVLMKKPVIIINQSKKDEEKADELSALIKKLIAIMESIKSVMPKSSGIG